MHSAAWQRSHNAVLDKFFKSILDRMGIVLINRQDPLVNNLRPDIVIIYEIESRITIIDVTIPFENEPQALERAKDLKVKDAGLVTFSLT